jgi:ppGpp synthetase/RelA/SpoT-type nucleotidyltranferase
MPSNSRVNSAGDAVRAYLVGEAAEHEAFAAVDVITAFRADFATPLQRVAANLRYYVEHHTVGRPIVVGQRLKRFVTIVDKLQREPKMQLSRMHDIGGCRAVVGTEDEIRAVASHLRRRWRIVREYDYMARPKPHSGYRAYHLVVHKDGHLIEVQLRTSAQHRWAELIEVVDRENPEFNLKGGSAPADLVEYYRLGSQLLASDERGEPADPAVVERFRRLHEEVVGYHRPSAST